MQTITASGPVSQAHFVTNGQGALIVLRNGSLEGRELSTGNIVKSWTPPAGLQQPYALLEKTNYIAGPTESKTIRVHHVGDDTVVVETPPTKERAGDLVISPNGLFLAAAYTQERVVRLYDVKTGKQTAEFPGGVGGNSALVISPDNKWLVVGAYDVTLRVFNLASMKLANNYDELSMAAFCAAYSADSGTLYVGTADGKLFRFQKGKSELLASKLTANINNILVLPDGNLVTTEFDPRSTAFPTVVRSWNPKPAEIAKLPKTPNTLFAHHSDPNQVIITDGTPDVRVLNIR